MKRAAILVLAIATLVMIVSPSASLLAGTPSTKSGTNAPSVIAPGSNLNPGPTTSSGGGGGGGGGNDQGDADGLSGMKIKPLNQSDYAATMDRTAITLMLWWRYMLLIR